MIPRRQPREFVRQLALLGVIARQKFVQRRIEKTDCGRQSFQRGENPNKIFPLVGQQFGDRASPFVFGASQDHFAHRVDPVAFKKHMLGSAKADAFSAECDCVGHLFRRIGVRSDTEFSEFVRPSHQFCVLAIGEAFFPVEGSIDQDLNDFRWSRGYFAGENFAGCSIYRNVIALR